MNFNTSTPDLKNDSMNLRTGSSTKTNAMNSKANLMDLRPGLSLKSPRGSRPFFLRSEMDRLLSLSMLFSCFLVVARVLHTGRFTFLFLVWNLFLAYLPYFITTCLSRMQGLPLPIHPGSLSGSGHPPLAVPPSRPSRWLPGKALFAACFLVWLLFIPNSFYIITDLFHLGDWYNDRLMPQWYDLAMILSFTWNGLLLGVLSVRQMEKILRPRLAARHELFFLYPIMWLNALGVYIGRYLRFNSWDIITNPFQLFSDIARIVLHPLRNQYAWDMIFCFSILMTLMYLMLKRISHPGQTP